MQLMEILLIATGFSGGLTLVWLARAAAGLFASRPATEPHFGPGTLDRVLRELAAARREVLLFTDGLNCPVVAQALVEARARKAQVDVVLGAVAETDSESSLPFLLDNGLAVMIEDHATRLSGNVLVIDGRTLVVASGPFHPDEEQHAAGCHLIVWKDQPEVVGPFREQVLARRTTTRPARRTLGPAAVAPQQPFPSYTAPEPPAPSYTDPEPPPVAQPPAPSYTAPEPPMPAASSFPSYTTPEPEPEPEPDLPPPTPTVASLLSRPLATFEPPAENDEALRMPRRPSPPDLSDDEFDGQALPDQAPSGAPPVTLAAAELFARLRREVAARAEPPSE
jgi:hypothetical protein